MTINIGSPASPATSGQILQIRTDLGLAPGWRMVGTEPNVIQGQGNAAELKTFRGGIVGWAFAPTSMTESFIQFDVPLDYQLGTDLYLAIHWSPGNSTATGNVKWGIEYIFAPLGSAFSAPAFVYIQQPADGTPYKHYQLFNDEQDKIPGAAVTRNMRFLLRLFRDGAHPSDSFPADAFLIGIDFFYRADKFGAANRTAPYE